jgi:hypothetical protein
MQAMIQDPTQRAIYIAPLASTTTANRTVLGAYNNPVYAPKLLLTYTVLD